MMTVVAELLFDRPETAASKIGRHLDKRAAALGLLNRGVSNLPQQIGRAIANLLDQPIAGVVLYAWVKQRAIHNACNQTRGIPGASESVVVADHTIEVEHRPRVFLDVAGQRVPVLELVLTISLHLESVTVTVIEGSVAHVGPGDASSTAELGVAMPGGRIYPVVRRELARVSMARQELVAIGS